MALMGIIKEDSKDAVSMKNNKSEMDCLLSTKSSEDSISNTCQESSKITVSDLNLLVNMFFLPYEHGPWAVKMLRLIKWLRCHSFLISRKNRLFSRKSSDTSEDQIKDIISETENKLKIFEVVVLVDRNTN